MLSPAVAPTPLDDPLAAGNNLGLFGYLHDEFSTLVPSFFGVNSLFAGRFAERGECRETGCEWAWHAAALDVCIFLCCMLFIVCSYCFINCVDRMPTVSDAEGTPHFVTTLPQHTP